MDISLNEQQRQAVVLTQGAVLVVAGAGSGKTRVITARMAAIIADPAHDPSSIVALTFTNKAAQEMRARLLVAVPSERASKPFVGTFHAYCLLLLRMNAHLLQFPQFSILDADDQESILKKIITTQGLQKRMTPSQAGYGISALKNNMITDGQRALHDVTPLLRDIYLAYETEKENARCFDFDDLLIQVLRLCRKNQDFKQRLQDRIKHVLVDEYQDTSLVQHELLKALVLNEEHELVAKSLCVVGDEDQSIYSWRGADVTNMLKFQKDFAPVTVVKIEQNYRSVQPILHAANDVIGNNRLRNPKQLWSDRKASDRILHLACRSGEHEAEAVSQYVQALPAGTKLHNVAILYRTHAQSRLIEEAFLRDGIGYKIIGGIRFYERKEIKDLLAYLRLFMNPFDKISAFRIINCPPRGLGKKFEEQVMLIWNQNPFLDFFHVLEELCRDDGDEQVTGKKRQAVQELKQLFVLASRRPTEVLDHIIKKSEYFAYIRSAYDAREAEAKVDNIYEFIEAIKSFEHIRGQGVTLEDFLYDVALIQEKYHEKESQDQVQLMTLHAAKGLEFDYVIIPGIEEGLLPSMRSLEKSESLEEERRLFYVGITRARERLVLLTAQYRSMYGQMIDYAPSRFLTEIRPGILRVLKADHLYGMRLRAVFEEWLGVRNVHTARIQTFS